MSKRKRIGRLALCLIVSFVMVMTLIPRMPATMAYAEDVYPETADAQTVADDEQVVADEDPVLSDEEEVQTETPVDAETDLQEVTETPVDTETDQQEVSVEENSPEQKAPAEETAEEPEAAAVDETAAQEQTEVKGEEPAETKDEVFDGGSLFAKGKHFSATVTYGPEAGIPEGSVLKLTEFSEGSEAFE